MCIIQVGEMQTTHSYSKMGEKSELFRQTAMCINILNLLDYHSLESILREHRRGSVQILPQGL